jgi:hypothetical protein
VKLSELNPWVDVYAYAVAPTAAAMTTTDRIARIFRVRGLKIGGLGAPTAASGVSSSLLPYFT